VYVRGCMDGMRDHRRNDARPLLDEYRKVPVAIIHSQNTCDVSTLETYYLNFIASQLYIRKSDCSILSLYLRTGMMVVTE